MAFVPRDPQHRDELRAFTEKVFVIVGVAVLLAILWAARHVLFLVFIAAGGVAVLIVYLPFVVLVLLLLIVVVPRVITETRSLGAQLPALIDQNILTPLERFVPMGGARAYISQHGLALPRASVVVYVRNAAAAVGSFIAVLFMVVYMLIDANRLRSTILLLYPPEVRARRRVVLNRIGRRMSSWLAGQLILSGMMGVAVFVGLLLLRVPYALPLAMFATVGEMVPVIGLHRAASDVAEGGDLAADGVRGLPDRRDGVRHRRRADGDPDGGGDAGRVRGGLRDAAGAAAGSRAGGHFAETRRVTCHPEQSEDPLPAGDPSPPRGSG